MVLPNREDGKDSLPPQCPECGCTLEDTGEHFQILGKVYFIYTIDLKDFIVKEDNKSLQQLERLRGRESLAQAMKKAKPAAAFQENDEDNKTVNQGYRFAAFRTRFKDGWLFTTYHPDDSAQPEEPELATLWEKYYVYIRFSRLGLLEIKLRKIISTKQHSDDQKSPQALIEAMNDLLDTRASDIEARLVRYVAMCFIREMGALKIKGKDGKQDDSIQLSVDAFSSNGENEPQNYERYTILSLDKVQCICGNRIGAQQLLRQHKSVLGAMLEGNLVREPVYKGTAADGFFLPSIDLYSLKRLKDLGSWQDDLCFFSHERALFYYPDVKMRIPPFASSDDSEEIDYNIYWNCILRIIEHTASMRTVMRILESRTTDAMSEVSDLTQRVFADNDIAPAERQEIREMAKQISEKFSVLPLLRDALVPTSHFRAAYAVTKFEYLTEEIFHLDDILGHIQRNIDEAFEFLQYFKSVQIQNETEREGRVERLMARFGAIVALLAFIAIFPSFANDLLSFLREMRCVDSSVSFSFTLGDCDFRGLFLTGIFYLALAGLGFIIADKIFQRILPAFVGE